MLDVRTDRHVRGTTGDGEYGQYRCYCEKVSHRAALNTRRALDPWRDAWYLDEEFQTSQPLPLELSPRTHDDWPLPAAPACDR